jgi:hypothetical protein
MLDTNVFNDVVDGKIPVEKFRGARVFATHVQMDELQQAKSERAAELLNVFEKIGPQCIATSSATRDVSKWDESGWTPEDGQYKNISRRLRELAANWSAQIARFRWRRHPRRALAAHSGAYRRIAYQREPTAGLSACGLFRLRGGSIIAAGIALGMSGE